MNSQIEKSNFESKNLTKSDKTRQLTDKHLRAIPLILNGKTDSEVAEAVGVSRQTINYWKNKDIYFQAELIYQRREAYDSQIEQIRGLFPKAVDVIEDGLNSKDPKVRREAARFYFNKLNLKPSGHITPEEIENDLKLINDRWDFFKQFFDDMQPNAIRNLLEEVRDTRNDLAHFKGELSSDQQSQLQFCADWISRCYKRLQAKIEEKSVFAPAEEKTGVGKGKYAPLAIWLQSQMGKINRLKLSFEEIEEIIEDDLPSSAYSHLEWWANDSVGHIQSKLWLDAGWRVAGKNLSKREISFVRIREREKAYIEFWNNLYKELEKSKLIPFEKRSPGGASWIQLLAFTKSGSRKAYFSLSFALRRRFRIELYINSGNKLVNKKIFDSIFNKKEAIERELGINLSWERLDDRKASRIALYTNGNIMSEQEELDKLIFWIIDTTPKFYKQIIKPLE